MRVTASAHPRLPCSVPGSSFVDSLPTSAFALANSRDKSPWRLARWLHFRPAAAAGRPGRLVVDGSGTGQPAPARGGSLVGRRVQREYCSLTGVLPGRSPQQPLRPVAAAPKGGRGIKVATLPALTRSEYSNDADGMLTSAMNDRTNFYAKSPLLPCQEPAAVAEASCQNGQGNAIPPQKAEKSPPSALEELLEDAELLAGYATRYGVSNVLDASLTVARARKWFSERALLDDAEKQQLCAAFRTLAEAVAPVTPASIQASLKRYGHPVGLFRKQKSLSTIEITRRWYYAIAACIILFVFQALWTVGSNLLSALPTPPADEATIMARITASPTEQGSLDYSLWVIRRQNAVKDLTAWVKLTNPLDFDDWKPNTNTNTGDPKSPTPTDLITIVTSKQPLSTGSIDPIIETLNWEDTIITEAKNRMDLLQQFILPLLYGWIGALAYILRSLSEQIRLWTYRKENTVLCDLRMLLGMVAGLAIGWFFKPPGTEVNGVGLVSPFALAFLAGYSVDLLFTVMDRVVATFSKAVPIEPPGRTPPITRAIADSSPSDAGSAKVASSDSAKSARAAAQSAA
jgi:hypothetical protein